MLITNSLIKIKQKSNKIVKNTEKKNNDNISLQSNIKIRHYELTLNRIS